MKITYNFDRNSDPNLFGEALRNEFFNQDYGELGCYETFGVRNDVKQLPDEVDSYFEDITWKCYEKEIDGVIVLMRYFWDGDGVLEFEIEDDLLTNDDCKKTHNWELVSSF